MALVWCVIFLAAQIHLSEARITAEICQMKPAERYCVIEHMSVNRWPHTDRFVFDWRSQTCLLMHWSKHCPLPQHEANNFATEEICMYECSGWA